MSKKMLLLSGPKLCGKGTLLQECLSQYQYSHDVCVKEAACKGHLYKLVQDIFLISEERFWEIYNDRELKEKPLPEFRVTLKLSELTQLENLVGELSWGSGVEINWKGTTINLSIRQAMIYVSEILIKPRFGMDYFGRARMETIKNPHPHIKYSELCDISYIFYDDSSASFQGSSDELVGLVDYFGEDNILLINIRGRGEFGVGNSRNYHAGGTVKHTVDLWNTGTEEQFLEKGCNIIGEFLDK